MQEWDLPLTQLVFFLHEGIPEWASVRGESVGRLDHQPHRIIRHQGFTNLLKEAEGH